MDRIWAPGFQQFLDVEAGDGFETKRGKDFDLRDDKMYM